MVSVLLFLSAMIGGVMNSVAGGGSFFTFPMLLFTGMNPIVANATSTMALWPGMVASVVAYRSEIAANRARLPMLMLPSLIGSVIGAIVLLKTPAQTFSVLVPYLLLLATLLFAFSPLISQTLAKRAEEGRRSLKVSTSVSFALQMIIGAYGGYFGGGMGIMMLAMLALMGLTRIHEMNALKTVLTTIINGVAIVIFVAAHIIAWKEALLMLVGAVMGGYGGAYFSRRLPPRYVRWFVIATGFTLTVYFFMKG